MREEKRLKRCFISAPADLNIKPLMRLLQQKGIDAHDAFSVSYFDTMMPQVEKEIENSDFVVAVVSLKDQNPNIFYEIGFARAARKPIFLVIQDEGAMPPFFKDLVYVKATLNNVGSIDYILDKFLSEHKLRPRGRPSRIVSHPKAKPLVTYIDRYSEGLLRQGREIDLVRYVADLLDTEGVVLDLGPKEKGADISIWVDSLESSLGNPILVDVKTGNLSESILMRAEEELRKSIRNTNARAGLLVYADRRGRHFKRSSFKLPLVVRFDLRDLVEKLSEHPIDYVLLSERNRIAHSGE